MKKFLLPFFLVVLALTAFSFSYTDSATKAEKPVSNVPDSKPETGAEKTLNKTQLAEEAFLSIFNNIDFAEFDRPEYELFRKGLVGFLNLRKEQKEEVRNVLTLIDFTLPSSEKRMWVIDLDKMKVLFHELVAHGRNSGELYATKFSNVPNSNSSSLGFYLTGEKYVGKYGLSLRLDGMEKGYNDLARARAVVLHGADYASQAFVEATGRLGRSFGCPAVPFKNKDAIVEAIANRSVLFIYGPDSSYEQQSLLMNQPEAVEYFASRSYALNTSAPL